MSNCHCQARVPPFYENKEHFSMTYLEQERTMIVLTTCKRRHDQRAENHFKNHHIKTNSKTFKDGQTI